MKEGNPRSKKAIKMNCFVAFEHGVGAAKGPNLAQFDLFGAGELFHLEV